MRADGWYWVRKKDSNEDYFPCKYRKEIWYLGANFVVDGVMTKYFEIDETPLDREKRFGIKPLEWHCRGGENYVADTPFGKYYVSYHFGVWRINSKMMVTENYATLDEAKAACESHYREQVLKCLTE